MSRKRTYIGLATTVHDPAIAVVSDKGELLFAEATERPLQKKRAWNCVPDDMALIDDVLDTFWDGESDIVVSKSWSKKTECLLKWFQPILEKGLLWKQPPWSQSMLQGIMRGIRTTTELAGHSLKLRVFERNPSTRIICRSFDHHLTHAVAACVSSPFEEAVCAVIDGIGEGASTAFFLYTKGKVTPLSAVKPSRSASLGFFYAGLCKGCGFDPIKGEEWKVMGLAPYGKEDGDMKRLFQERMNVKQGRLMRGKRSDELTRTLIQERRSPQTSVFEVADFAATGQNYFCDSMTEIIDYLFLVSRTKNLVLTGGCALNSSYNGKILEKTSYENLYVFSAPGDDGNAIGAAYLGYKKDKGNVPLRKSGSIQSPYLGSRLCTETLDRLENMGQFKNSCPDDKKITHVGAELLSRGKIIGWVQGRSEFGPRALGNRSILADPRTAEMKDELNSRIKFRESFRPFAPSILHEYGPEYFEDYQESPYMDRTLRFRREVYDKVPAVVHEDGTGRLQTVKSEWNQKYYELIDCFYKRTGIPLILNTSFNIMGKPIIHSVEDAVAMFQTTGLDALIIEDRLYLKEKNDG